MIAFLRHLLLEDLWLKLFSLALAVLTWIAITFALVRDQSPVGVRIEPADADISGSAGGDHVLRSGRPACTRQPEGG